MDEILSCVNHVYKQITNNEPITDRQKWETLKKFICQKNNHEISIMMKNWIIKNYLPLFLNPELQNSFNLPDTFKYYKEQKIFLNLPFTTTTELYPSYFYNLIYQANSHYGGIPNIYDGLQEFFQENNYYLPEGLIEQIKEYWNNHQSIKRASKGRPYLSYYEEVKRYLDTKDSESLGHIGEYDFFDRIKNTTEAIFTAKDLGNGFGYDMYYQNPTKEELIEVKATARKDGKDYIRLTDNEIKKIKKKKKQVKEKKYPEKRDVRAE